jgi:exodeoxyribonuclease III
MLLRGDRMKIATWNVNSIRARLDRLVAWLDGQRPDIVCLQETKVEDATFPIDVLASHGYQAAIVGQRTYNGVAILSRTPLTEVERGLPGGDDDPQARFVAATTAGLRIASVYVPNGEAVDSPKFAYKLGWLARLHAYVAQLPASVPTVIGGDYNVAPAAIDCYDPAAWAGSVLCSEPERAAFFKLLDTGLIDLVRHLNPTTPCFSWWDYRMLAFPKNKGLRIDHLLATPAFAERAIAAGVDRDARKGKQPSDHAPVWVELRG